MTSISTSLAGYQNTNQAAQVKTTVSTAATTVADETSDQTSNEAYMLSLSAEAQKYLSALSGTARTGAAPSSSYDDDNAEAGFNLSKQQRKEVIDILTKYKSEPQNEETYNKIQDDFKAAGIAPDQMAAKDAQQSFSATNVLLSALNGDFTDVITTNKTNSEGKAKTYLDYITAQWKKVSGVVEGTSGASA